MPSVPLDDRDVSGLWPPSLGGGTAVDVRQAFHAAEVGAAAHDALIARAERSARADAGHAARLAAAVAELPWDARGRVFASPSASRDVEAAAGTAARTCADVVAGIGRHLLHHPDVGRAVVCFPATTTVRSWVVPHLRAAVVIPPSTPCVATSDGERTTITWSDGNRATIPVDDRARPIPRTVTLATLGRFVVLNGSDLVGELGPEVSGLDPLDPGAPGLAGALANASSGVELLRRVWPAAAAAAERHVRQIVLLRPRGFERSDSPASLPGMVALTSSEPWRVGDLLCHEAAHVRFGAVLRSGPLFVGPDPPIHRSPWRPDPRPLLGLILGVHAFVDVCEWWRRAASAAPDVEELARTIRANHLAKVRSAWATIGAADPEVTPLGRAVLDSLADAVDALGDART
jgi:HEXXH motif-containing protein